MEEVTSAALWDKIHGDRHVINFEKCLMLRLQSLDICSGKKIFLHVLLVVKRFCDCSKTVFISCLLNIFLYMCHFCHFLYMSEKKEEEILLSPMTKAPLPTEMSNGQSENTKTQPKRSIRRDCGPTKDGQFE